MNQATDIRPLPTDLTPEFTSWLKNEQSLASRHRSQILKVTLLVVLTGTALFIFKEQPNWVQQIVEVAQGIAV